jgi:hypothetical protein
MKDVLYVAERLAEYFAISDVPDDDLEPTAR